MVRRVAHYRIRSAETASELAFHHPEWPESGAHPGFAWVSTLSRELITELEDFTGCARTAENCRNCGQILTGLHCAHCGQRARVQVLSVGGLLRDVVGDLLNWDARLWRTLRPLAFRPGFLTSEYLMGRRTAYTPPFRMYLVISLLFFLLAPLDARFAIDPAQGEIPVQGGAASAAPSPPAPERAQNICREELHVSTGLLDAAWEPRILLACEKVLADPAGFGSAMLDNIPRMMFVFLPLLALIMRLLYLGSGRHYVEHLLFLVHVHAAFFLGALILLLLGQAERIPGTLGAALNGLAGACTAVLLTYLPYYLYRAMRRVYGQRRGWTLFKFSLLGIGYVTCLGLTATGLFLVTALER